jgi:tetratricopeptide (TPR) repeat protein
MLPDLTARGRRMAADESLLSIDQIEQELRSIEALLATEGRSRDESLQMLAKQAELLTSKARLFEAKGAYESATTAAKEAISLINALRPRADPMLAHELEAKWFEAHGGLGLIYVASRNLVEARKTVRFLRAQLHETKNNNLPTMHVARLEEALEREMEERRKLFDEQTAEREAEGETEGRDWDDAHIMLETLISEIAERMAYVGTIVGRVSNPEPFQNFLVERLRSNLLHVRQRPAGELTHVEIEMRQRAEERGKQLQRSVFESDEMFTAANFRSDAGPFTDLRLKQYRDNGTLLGLPHPNDPERFAYPKWQAGRYETVARVVAELRSLPAWAIWHFFHQSLPFLHDLTPLAVLLSDEKSDDPRLPRLRKEKGDVEHCLVAAARDYLSGED